MKKRTWKCEDCGDKLPRKGFVWKARFDKWRDSKRQTSGMLCDYCVEAEKY